MRNTSTGAATTATAGEILTHGNVAPRFDVKNQQPESPETYMGGEKPVVVDPAEVFGNWEEVSPAAGCANRNAQATVTPSPPAKPWPSIEDATATPSLPFEPEVADVQGVERDSANVPYDASKHAASKRKNLDGTWRKKRGVKDETTTSGPSTPSTITAAPTIEPEPENADAPTDAEYVALAGLANRLTTGDVVTKAQIMAKSEEFGLFYSARDDRKIFDRYVAWLQPLADELDNLELANG